jgi:hypothetical protein
MSANDRSGRRWAVAALTVVVALAPSFGALAAGAAPPDTAASVAVSDSSTDETTPDPGTPESTPPETAAPETTTDQTTPTPSVVGGDTDDSTTLTWVAIIAAGSSFWKMFRRASNSKKLSNRAKNFPASDCLPPVSRTRSTRL